MAKFADPSLSAEEYPGPDTLPVWWYGPHNGGGRSVKVIGQGRGAEGVEVEGYGRGVPFPTD